MKRLLAGLLSLALLLPQGVVAQGFLPSGNVLGNSGATSAPPGPTTITAILDRAFGATTARMLMRGTSAWVAQAMSGDGTLSAAGAFTLATVNANVGTFGSATSCVTFTTNAKGLLTAVSAATCTPAASSITGGAALTKVDDTNVTLTLGGGAAGALLSASSLTLGWTGTLAAARLNSNVVQSVVNDTNITGSISAQALTLGWTGQCSVSRGCTGLSSGTSGGILGYTATGTLASSVALTANAIVLGGGAGATPTPLGSLGTTTTVLHGNAAGTPTFGAVANADLANSAITIGGASTALGGTVTASTILDSISSTRGNILYRGASGWVALTNGVAGTVLSSNGVGADPSYVAAGGTGTVTSVTPGAGIVSSVAAACSQSAVTTTGTLSKAECVNAQTGTTYAIVDGDRAKLITGSNSAAQAYSIAQAGAASAFQNGWYVDLRNVSTATAGIITITPTTSTINGAATYAVRPGQSVRIVSDGTNYQTALGHDITGANVQYFTSGSSATLNVPAGARYIVNECWGGGGGGGGSSTHPAGGTYYGSGGGGGGGGYASLLIVAPTATYTYTVGGGGGGGGAEATGGTGGASSIGALSCSAGNGGGASSSGDSAAGGAGGAGSGGDIGWSGGAGSAGTPAVAGLSNGAGGMGGGAPVGGPASGDTGRTPGGGGAGGFGNGGSGKAGATGGVRSTAYF